LFVKSSSFNSNVIFPKNKKKLIYRLDNVSDELYSIHILQKNEVGKEITVGWLEFDYKNNRLNDVTIDPDSALELSFDTIYGRKLYRTCCDFKY